MATKTKKLPSRPGRRDIKKTASRVPARKKAKSKARTSSQRAGLSRLKKGKKKNAKPTRPVVKKSPSRNSKANAAKKRRAPSKLQRNARRPSPAKRVHKKLRDKRGRFTAARKPLRKKLASKPRRTARPFITRDETKIITCGGKGREVSLVGEFELIKRTMSFRQAPPRVDKLPYQKQIKSQAEKFYDDNGAGTYLFKTRISLQTDDGELVDRWFTPFARKAHDSAESFGRELDDLNLTMQEMARGYLKDAYENYRLEDLEFEYIDASKLIPSKKAD